MKPSVRRRELVSWTALGASLIAGLAACGAHSNAHSSGGDASPSAAGTPPSNATILSQTVPVPGPDSELEFPTIEPTEMVTATPAPFSAKSSADAGVLTSGDLPGYASAPSPRTPADDRVEQLRLSCMGLVVPHYLARNYGTRFIKGTTEIISSADVFGSHSSAVNVSQAEAGAKGPDCYRQTLTSVLATTAAGKSSDALITLVAVPHVEHADDVVAYHATGTLAAFNYKTAFELYYVRIRINSTSINLTTLTKGASSIDLGKIAELAAHAAARVFATPSA